MTTNDTEQGARREPADYDRTSDFRCPTCERHGRMQRNSCKRHEWANIVWVAPAARRTAADHTRIRR
ncbi:MAG: hypothetical protein EXR66_04305 [Dehalococcoidia bacterium]|nr:hypothetical protein [Dehalococcoidia bacterium]